MIALGRSYLPRPTEDGFAHTLTGVDMPCVAFRSVPLFRTSYLARYPAAETPGADLGNPIGRELAAARPARFNIRPRARNDNMDCRAGVRGAGMALGLPRRASRSWSVADEGSAQRIDPQPGRDGPGRDDP